MLRSTLLTAFSLLIISATASLAFQQQQQGEDGGLVRIPSSVSHSPSMDAPPTTSGDEIQRQQAIAANKQRLEQINRETQKLAELTAELKQYVDQSNKGIFSVDAIKKAEQIEKLAHSVRGKMKQSY